MNRQKLSETSFGYFDIDIINNESLKEFCLSHKENKLSNDITDTRNEDIKLSEDIELKFLLDTITTYCSEKWNKKVDLLDYWAQIHEKNESTNLHNHVDPKNLKESPDISGVYFVSLPKDSGKLVLQYNINQYEVKRWWPEIKEKRVLLFPATLDHFVTKNLSEDYRISIAFNLRVS